MFNKTTKATILMMFPVASLLALTGCESDEAVVPAAEPVDLTQVEDLFEQPLKAPAPPEPTTVVVRVNGEDITYGEILEAMKPTLQQMAGRVPPEQLQQVQARLFSTVQDQLIIKKLMDAAVAAANIEVAEEDITAEMEKIRASIPPGQNFEALLEAQGMTLEKLTADMREQMATHEFLTSKTEGIEDVTETEAKEFYDANPDKFKRPEGVAASHILIKFEADDTDEVKAEKKAQLEKIRADIVAETITFEDAAKEHSACPSSAKGGALGTFGKGQMAPEFELAAFTQEKDEVGDIIETSFGYHIVKVTEQQEEGVVEFEEVKESLVKGLSGQKKQEAVNDFIKSLRDGATIEMVPAP